MLVGESGQSVGSERGVLTVRECRGSVERRRGRLGHLRRVERCVILGCRRSPLLCAAVFELRCRRCLVVFVFLKMTLLFWVDLVACLALASLSFALRGP